MTSAPSALAHLIRLALRLGRRVGALWRQSEQQRVVEGGAQGQRTLDWASYVGDSRQGANDLPVLLRDMARNRQGNVHNPILASLINGSLKEQNWGGQRANSCVQSDGHVQSFVGQDGVSYVWVEDAQQSYPMAEFLARRAPKT